MRDIGDKMAENNIAYASRDIDRFLRGGEAPRPPGQMFDDEDKQKDYLEMLARLIGQDKFEAVVAGWHGGDKTAYANETKYGAAASLGRRRVPSYVDPYTEKTKTTNY